MAGWYVPKNRRLHWYERDGEAVVFNAQSGRSHFLNAMPNEVLHFIEEEGPSTANDIEGHIRSIVEEGDMPDLAEQVEQIVAGFLRQGLIDPWSR